jgi:hypothetical protein
MKKRLVWWILISLAACSCTTLNSFNTVPLPKDIKIISPASNLPPEIKAFSGKWGGKWFAPGSAATLDSVLIVEKVEEGKAIVYYCWGNCPEWRVTSGWIKHKTAKFYQENGKMILSFENGRYKFFIQGQRLEGFLDNPRGSITMKRLL